MPTYTNHMVLHVWAQRNVESGANGNGTISFRGPDLYSYDLRIGRFAAPVLHRDSDGNAIGPVALLLSADLARKPDGTASPTTAQHISKAAAAVRHLTHFTVLDVNPETAADHAGNLEYLRGQYRAEIARCKRSAQWRDTRPVADHIGAPFYGWIESAFFRAMNYAHVFEVDGAPTLAEMRADLEQLAKDCAAIFDSFNSEAGRAKRAADRLKRESAAERKAEAARAKVAQAVAEWRAGTRYSLPDGAERLPNGSAMLRVRGDNLETSQGATVPLSAAVRVFQFVKPVRATGQAWPRNGHRVPVGSFEVDHIAPDGTMRAGCHVIAWAEIEAAAEAASVASLPGSTLALESSDV